jgi:hypothetical protein
MRQAATVKSIVAIAFFVNLVFAMSTPHKYSFMKIAFLGKYPAITRISRGSGF